MVSFYKEFSKPNAVPGAAVSLVCGGAAAVMALALIASLGTFDPETSVGASIERGNILPALTSGSFWSSLGSMPSNWSVFLDPIPGGVIAGLFVLCALVMRTGMKRSWASVGITVLMLSALPLVAGTLSATKVIPVDLSTWLSTMLTAFALGAVTCGACALLHLLSPRKHRAGKKPGRVRKHGDVVSPDRRTA